MTRRRVPIETTVTNDGRGQRPGGADGARFFANVRLLISNPCGSRRHQLEVGRRSGRFGWDWAELARNRIAAVTPQDEA
jgi:hypothetical protein